MKLNELKRRKPERQIFLAASEACKVVFWSTPGLKKRTFDSSVFCSEDALTGFCVQDSILPQVEEKKEAQQRKVGKWRTGRKLFYSPFKHALVKPLLKKSNLDFDQLKHYRPVTNLPFLSKSQERVVHSHLSEHLRINRLIEPFKSAYHPSHSKETALLRVTNDLLMASDHGSVSVLSLLHFGESFDTIDHNMLLQPLLYLRAFWTGTGMVQVVFDWTQ